MMEELDLLKKDWKKNENSFQQVSELDIYKMIHKKSSSIVKWILIISILELLLWNVVSFMFLGDSYIKKKYGPEIFEYVVKINTIYNVINYIVVACFIYMFYINYKRISATKSTKQLMNDILKTRKTVQYYVWYNILFFVFGTLVIIYVQLNYDSKYVKIIERIHHDASNMLLLKSVGILFISLFIIVLIIWIFYKLLYGILLKKLYRNYKELKKIEL